MWEPIVGLLKSLGNLIALSVAVGMGLVAWGMYRAFRDQKRQNADEEARMRRLRRVRCPHCHDLIDRHATMCTHCYRDLKFNCVQCGEPLSIQAKVCPHCQTPNPYRRSIHRP